MGSTAVPRPDHVVMVMMENKGYDDILNNPSTKPQDQVPYIKSLETQGASFTSSYGVTHPSLPNYYSLLSGSDIVKTSAWPAPESVDTDNLPNQLVTHGYSFADYADQGRPTQWLRYKNIPGTADNLNPMDKRLADFPTTPAGFEALPTVSFVVGNGDQSMHDGTLAQGDAWVKAKFDSYIQWAKTHNSLFILTWDEDDFTPANHIPTIMVGPMARASEYDQKINHYNVLRTLLDMYGLDHINHTADADVSTITDPWDLSKTEPLRGMAGRCLENHQTNPAEPGALGMWHCEAAANQQWIRHADGTIRQSGKCLAATPDGNTTGLADCDGTPAQTWQPKADGSLLNQASGRCLTVPGPDIANGTPAELRDCDGKLQQRWEVPGFVGVHHSLTVDTPSVFKPGSAVTVTTTYTNDSSPVALSDASVSLTVPSGWTAEPTSPTTFNQVQPDQSVKTTWAVTAPADAKPDAYTLSAQATYKNAKNTDKGTGTTFHPAIVPQGQMRVAEVDSEETVGEDGRAANVLDGNPATIWHTRWYGEKDPLPHHIVLDLGEELEVTGLRYLPRQTGVNGRIAGYEVWASTDRTAWTNLATGTFANTTAEQTVTLNGTPARYLKLVATSSHAGPYTSAAELNVTRAVH
ncbi:alkaline phosphatase family protein [Saccharopolyspora shandongensis]|uniref:alkaline phosphatase family protein n=1 Tax=Saccharopolyspora shandongensis TaxID=418495 RepID=UPI0015A66298|nr:alkaline phosphatase family protein [Saccharopolyspora shandongensis]